MREVYGVLPGGNEVDGLPSVAIGPPNLTLELILTFEPHFGVHFEIFFGNHSIVPILIGFFSSMSNYIDSPKNHVSETIIFLRGTMVLAWS